MKAKPAKDAGKVVLELERGDEPLLEAAARGPFRLRKILVPVDFSDCSKKALQYAIPLAKQHRAAITLLHVVPPNYPIGEYGGASFASLEPEMRASGEKQLASLVVDELPGEVASETIVRSGLPAAEIIQVAKASTADLIVISTHGSTGLRHVFLGSVAEQVVRRAPCPVLVVREQEHEFLTP